MVVVVHSHADRYGAQTSEGHARRGFARPQLEEVVVVQLHNQLDMVPGATLHDHNLWNSRGRVFAPPLEHNATVMSAHSRVEREGFANMYRKR